jgi:TRAP-type C4-dicarboxylate transport system permease small subunit
LAALIRILKAFDSAVAAAELAIALASLAAILVLTAIPIALRAAGANAGAFWWTTPMSLYLLLTSTFFGASLAIRSRRHIQIDLVTRLLPRRAKAGMGVVSWLVAAAILAVLCRAAVELVSLNWTQVSKLRGVALFGARLPDVPLGPLQLAMPIALGIMSFRCLVSSLEDLRGVVTGDLAYLAQYEHAEGTDLHPLAPPPGEAIAGMPPPPPAEPEGGAT